MVAVFDFHFKSDDGIKREVSEFISSLVGGSSSSVSTGLLPVRPRQLVSLENKTRQTKEKRKSLIILYSYLEKLGAVLNSNKLHYSSVDSIIYLRHQNAS